MVRGPWSVIRGSGAGEILSGPGGLVFFRGEACFFFEIFPKEADLAEAHVQGDLPYGKIGGKESFCGLLQTVFQEVFT